MLRRAAGKTPTLQRSSGPRFRIAEPRSRATPFEAERPTRPRSSRVHPAVRLTSARLAGLVARAGRPPAAGCRWAGSFTTASPGGEGEATPPRARVIGFERRQQMTCLVCGSPFGPNRRTPRQKYCGAACRTKARALYKRRYDREWRRAHPEYMAAYGRRYRELYGPSDRPAERSPAA